MLESEAEALAIKVLHSFEDIPGMTAMDVTTVICLLFSKTIHAFTLEPTLYTAENRLLLLRYIETIIAKLDGDKCP